MNDTVQKLTLRVVGLAGAALFAFFFTLTYSVPGWVEEFAADYIEAEAREFIDNSIDIGFEVIQPTEGGGALNQLAQSLYERNQAELEQAKENLRTKVYEQWAAAIAEIRDLDCECREKWEQWFERGLTGQAAALQMANQQIGEFIQASYMDVATSLKADIRIFTASNALAFLLLLLVSFLKPQAITHLFLPGLLLALSTLVCSFFYVFEQNWLLTIIRGDYVGFAYIAWLAVVFGFLLDIAFNRARVTTQILNAIFEMIGAALTVVPC